MSKANSEDEEWNTHILFRLQVWSAMIRTKFFYWKVHEEDGINIDFSCKYLGGELTTSDESLHVKWVKKDEALNLVTFPLTKIRLENMLSSVDTISCFNFIREQFEVISEEKYSVGRK